MSEMEALIARLESASEGNDGLDIAVWACHKDSWPHTDNEWLRLCAKRGGTIPKFTTSLDAALTLVPEGCRWKIDSVGMATVMSRSAAFTFEGEHYDTQLPLALCIAALRARTPGPK